MNFTIMDKSQRMNQLIEAQLARSNIQELALGFLRYEALRKLHPSRYEELHKRNVKGERFDDMVDDLVLMLK